MRPVITSDFWARPATKLVHWRGQRCSPAVNVLDRALMYIDMSYVLYSWPTNHIVWIATTLPACISLCLKDDFFFFFFRKLFDRCLLCLIRTSFLVITQRTRIIQRRENFLDSAINFFYATFCIGSVKNWKTTACFEPHFLPAHWGFWFHSAPLIPEGGQRGEEKWWFWQWHSYDLLK